MPKKSKKPLNWKLEEYARINNVAPEEIEHFKEFEMELERGRDIPEQWSRELWPPKLFPKEALEFYQKSERNIEIENKWLEIAQTDPFKAMIDVENDLESLPLVRNHVWTDVPCHPCPCPCQPDDKLQDSPFLLPKVEKHAEIINDILVKSWETQGSSCRDISVHKDQVLMSGQIKDVHGMLLYYFKCLNVADDLKQVIGVTECSLMRPPFLQANSWLKTGNGHVIDNLFSSKGTPEQCRGVLQFTHYIDDDPALPKYADNPNFRSILGGEYERKLYSPDQVMEQNVAMYSSLHANGPFRNALYDVKMRKYIKEKYGVVIESLIQKWSKLCWNCGKASENLKKCGMCKMSLYCSKTCQIKDWKRNHKLRHMVLGGYFSEMNYIFENSENSQLPMRLTLR